MYFLLCLKKVLLGSPKLLPRDLDFGKGRLRLVRILPALQTIGEQNGEIVGLLLVG